MGAAEVAAFLTYLATDRNVAAATQNQAKAALLFLYREVLGIDLPWLTGIAQAKTPDHLPVVLTVAEVAVILGRLRGVHHLIGALLYGTGLRIMEALRLRVKDVDFDRRAIVVRDGKGFKDRVTVLPGRLIHSLADQVAAARGCTRPTWRKAVVKLPCRSRSPANTPTLAGPRAGSTYFRPTIVPSIRARTSSGGITSGPTHSSAP